MTLEEFKKEKIENNRKKNVNEFEREELFIDYLYELIEDLVNKCEEIEDDDLIINFYEYFIASTKGVELGFEEKKEFFCKIAKEYLGYSEYELLKSKDL